MFEAFCNQQGYRHSKIAVSSSKTPDYEVVTQSGHLIFEVKQFDPNPDELAAQRALAQGEIKAVSSKVGQRVRSAICTAVRQLKRTTNGSIPGVVVVCDPNWLLHGGQYNIRVAMYGFDTIVYSVPQNPAVPPRVAGRKSGGDRTMTQAHCTSISALAELRKLANEAFELDVYHNHFARIPLDPATLRSNGVKQYRLANSVSGHFDSWESM
jgi:hypothetical protein